MPSKFGVVDLFAGPGGLGEGFASFQKNSDNPFHIHISIEKEASAHRTLMLRAFLRRHQSKYGTLPKQFVEFHAGLIGEPDWAAVDKTAWKQAEVEAMCLELGTSRATDALRDSHTKLRRFDDTILIGGPPCQAYSLVGRARAKGNRDYVPEDDNRHYLFREYIRVLDRLRPAAFVMENVKGMLSSTVESRLVFEMLMEDLSSLGARSGCLYELRAIRVANGSAYLSAAKQPSDYIVRSEEFSIPQRRHRVIIIGLRSDIAAWADQASVDLLGENKTVAQAICNLPLLRSGLSRGADDPMAWRATIVDAAKQLSRLHRSKSDEDLRAEFDAISDHLRSEALLPRQSRTLPKGYARAKDPLLRWLERRELRGVAQHESRGHMPSDLGRYLFAAVFAKRRGYSPKAADFPSALTPDHRNWHSGIFADRFRVQLSDDPSTTVTSHISKDGHYFVHPDPGQCRSLTVREAARLQTFPDDYLFLGNRTQQYVQVGNAVPPLLARQIAALLFTVLDKSSGGKLPQRLR